MTATRARFKVDEDLPGSVTRLLIAAGADAISVRDQAMQGWPDSRLWKAVQQENRILVTADKGFGDVRAFPPGSHHGIVLLRPLYEGPRAFVELAAALMATVNPLELEGCLAVVSSAGVRIRRA